MDDDRWWVADTERNPRFDLYSRGNTGEVFPHVVSALTGTLIAGDVDQGQLRFLRETGLLTRREFATLRGGTGVFGDSQPKTLFFAETTMFHELGMHLTDRPSSRYT